MGIFKNLFGAVGGIGEQVYQTKKQSSYIGDDVEQVPFGNLKKIKDSTVSTNLDYSTTNYYNEATGEGSEIVIQTKKEQKANAYSSEEKPVNVSPSLLGSGGSTATGEGEVSSSGGSILTYVLVGAGALVGGYFLFK